MAYAAAVADNARRTLNRKQLIVPVRIPADLAAKLDRAVSGLRYASRNEFIREAIEQHVNDRLGSKMIEVRDVSVKGAARMMDRYLSKSPGAHYVSELAEELGLELDVAFKAARMLEAQGMVKARSK
ncbi:MAG: ribbon-helix-helix domain-containing protein [Nitrososphaerales archaeon]|nr:ribbon-helix-helix domain-containing protein [Nitrososphaerales archaeon]